MSINVQAILTDAFNIPRSLNHDHGEESLSHMRKGLELIKSLLSGGNHDKCIEHVVVYSELNINFFFAASLIKDKSILKEALDLYIENLVKLFLKEVTT